MRLTTEIEFPSNLVHGDVSLNMPFYNEVYFRAGNLDMTSEFRDNIQVIEFGTVSKEAARVSVERLTGKTLSAGEWGKVRVAEWVSREREICYRTVCGSLVFSAQPELGSVRSSLFLRTAPAGAQRFLSQTLITSLSEGSSWHDYILSNVVMDSNLLAEILSNSVTLR